MERKIARAGHFKRSARLHEHVLAIAAFNHQRRCQILRRSTARMQMRARPPTRHDVVMMPAPARADRSRPSWAIRSASDQPLVTIGGALPLPTPTQPETLTATSVATSANRSFFIGIPSGYCLCGELNGHIATRISTVELVLKSHSTYPNRTMLDCPHADHHFGACGPSIPLPSADIAQVLGAPATLPTNLRVIGLTELRRAASTAERRRSGNRHPPSFQWRANRGRPNRSGLPLRRHRSGCVVRAKCAKARRGEQ
jgi:hypothetical protein